MNFNITNSLTTAGAIGGILYGIKKQSGFWATAGYTIILALAGTALGMAISSTQKK
jgi:hypothetical protein